MFVNKNSTPYVLLLLLLASCVVYPSKKRTRPCPFCDRRFVLSIGVLRAVPTGFPCPVFKRQHRCGDPKEEIMMDIEDACPPAYTMLELLHSDLKKNKIAFKQRA